MTHSKMRLIVASNNSNKLREFHEILGERFDIVSMHEAGIDADIEESGTTFEENALIKANYVMNACHCAAIADDSGLEVDALGGAPGVYSARYCGRHGDDDANNALLLRNLEGIPAPRKARYVAAIALVRSGHAPIVCRGTCEGEILTEGRGNGGFGYDPLFLCETGKTLRRFRRKSKTQSATENAESKPYCMRWRRNNDPHRRIFRQPRGSRRAGKAA